MKKIETIRICGTDLSLEFLEPSIWAYNGMGRFSEIESRICIQSELTKSGRNNTVLHECVHAMLDIGGLHSQVSDIEQFTTAFSAILHAFIKKTQETPDRELKLARRRMKEVTNG